MDSTAKNLCSLCRRLARKTNRAVSTISRLSTGSGDTIDRLERGGAITTRRVDRALEKLSEMWPDDLAWPADIPRPAKSKPTKVAS